MSAQDLGARRVRLLAKVTGLDVVRGWADGSYVFEFVTSDHRHGWFNLTAYRQGDGTVWEFYDPTAVTHYTSCRTFEDWPDVVRAWRGDDAVKDFTEKGSEL